MCRSLPSTVLMLGAAWTMSLLVPELVRSDDLQALAASGTLPRNTRLLMLRDGSVVRGVVSLVPGGYEVAPDPDLAEAAAREAAGTTSRAAQRLAIAKEVFAFEQVQLTAESLQDAYVKMREAIEFPSAPQHVRLAEWCLGLDLRDEARKEALAALKLEPDRSEFRELLLRIDGPPTELPVGAQRSGDGFRTEEPRAFGRLTAIAAATYMRQVQPLVVQRCGNAKCHGNPESPFHVRAVRGASALSQAISESNLRTILDHIDESEPTVSPLLVRARGDEPGHPGIEGAAAAKQLQILTDWVLAVSSSAPTGSPRRTLTEPRKLAVPEDIVKLAPRPALSGVVPASGERVSAAAPQTHSPVAAGLTPAPATLTEEERALRETILEQSRPDAFDPEEFNRRFR